MHIASDDWFWVLVAVWLGCCLAGARFVTALVRYRGEYIYAGPSTVVEEEEGEPYRLIVRYATRSGLQVADFASTLAQTRKTLWAEDELQVVSDDPLDAAFTRLARVTVVPSDYSAEPATRKARALQYAIEGTDASSDVWVLHMDEETNIVAQTREAIHAFIMERRGLIGIGPIFYTSHFLDVNPILRVNEALRSAQCYECLQQTHTIPSWLHGSNLLIRSDIEREVGWKNGGTVAEDQLFGVEAGRRLGKVFGWTGAMAFEQPPLTFRDNFRQRLRWYNGCLQNLKFMDKRMKVRVGLNLGLWTAGFLSAILSLPLLVLVVLNLPYEVAYSLLGSTSRFPGWLSSYTTFMQHFTPQTPILTAGELILDMVNGQIFRYLDRPDSFLLVLVSIALLFSLVSWVLPYMLGLRIHYRFLKLSRRERVKGYAQSFVILPLAAVVECLPAFVGFFRWLRRKEPDEWVPTRK